MIFLIVLQKELLEQWRTWRFLIVASMFVALGMASPLLAKWTPDLLKSIPDMPPALAEIIPPPTVNDAVTQYVKNLNQFGILLALLMSMGAVAQEKERGTAALMFTHPISHLAFLLAKFTSLAIVFAVSLALAALGGWYYTWFLFEKLPWGPFLALNSLMWLAFLVYIALSLLGSTLARSQGAAAGLAFLALLLLGGLGAVPGWSDYLPGRLFRWGSDLVLGSDEPAWQALWVSLGLILTALGLAWLIFRQQEI